MFIVLLQDVKNAGCLFTCEDICERAYEQMGKGSIERSVKKIAAQLNA
jgi:hypothetical protein